MKTLISVISTNRRLQNLNLSWNILADMQTSEKEQKELVSLIGSFLKHNKNLIHLDLTCTGLSEFIIRAVGTTLRRAASVLAIHLSGNPGLTADNLEYLP